MATALILNRIVNELKSFAFSFGDEAELHAGVAQVLTAAGVTFRREHVAGPDRFDFLCDGGVVVEAKIKGSFSAALRQAARYCKNPEALAVLIVATPRWALLRQLKPNAKIGGKPVRLIRLGVQAF